MESLWTWHFPVGLDIQLNSKQKLSEEIAYNLYVTLFQWISCTISISERVACSPNTTTTTISDGCVQFLSASISEGVECSFHATPISDGAVYNPHFTGEVCSFQFRGSLISEGVVCNPPFKRRLSTTPMHPSFQKIYVKFPSNPHCRGDCTQHLQWGLHMNPLQTPFQRVFVYPNVTPI